MGERPSRPASLLVVSNHGAVVGGGELSLIDLLRGLDRDRWAPVLVVPEDGEVAARGRDLDLPVHVIALPGLRRPGPGSLKTVAALVRLARATDAALIHANGSRAMAYAGIAGRLAARPTLWHVRIA
ncbi:MAG: glycosyltransferase, partial [Candidatus Rokuibacteriota bacterium]